MQDIFGWIGIGFVASSYAALNSKKPNFFLSLNALGSISLLFHSIIINDYPFIALSTLAVFTLTYRLSKGGIKKIDKK